MIEWIHREAIYPRYYLDKQVRQIAPCRALGILQGSAAAFMITGHATRITNLGAVKIVPGWKRFIVYILFTMAFAWGTGMIVNLIL